MSCNQINDKLFVIFKGDDEEPLEDQYTFEFSKYNMKSIKIPSLSFNYVNNDVLKGYLKDPNISGIIFTSPRSVNSIYRLNDLNIKEILQHKLIFCVGPKTASTVKNKIGLSPHLLMDCETIGNGENLSSFIITQKSIINGPLLMPCSSIGTETINAKLSNAGISLISVVAYHTTPYPFIEQKLQIHLRDFKGELYFIYFSPSGILAVKNNCNKLYLDKYSIHHIAIGNTTKKALDDLGLPVFCVAEKPTPSSLLDAIIKCLKEIRFRFSRNMILILFNSFLVILSCCANTLIFEYILRIAPNSPKLITFSHNIFNLLFALVFMFKFLNQKRKIPLRIYCTMVVFNYLTSLAHNIGFHYKISVPLSLVLKSGSLFTNMLLSRLIFDRRYTRSKYLAVSMVTFGMIICTISSYYSQITQISLSYESQSLFKWCLGVLSIFFALFFSSYVGILQEMCYLNYGKNSEEMFFYMNFLQMPCFLVDLPNFFEQFTIFNSSWTIFMIPHLWICLFFDDLTSLICSKSVFKLTTECQSLTVTLVITLRKFISLVISIFFFENVYTVYHWVGTFLVFFGTLIFTDAQVFFLSKYKTKIN